MSHHATIETIVRFLDHGTGDPGLRFADIVDDLTEIREVRNHEYSDLWTVHPLTVVNVDGPHERCLLCITFCLDADTEEVMVRFLALDPWGQPVAYHEAG